MMYIYNCVCVCVRQETSAIPSNLLWCYIFVVPYNRCLYHYIFIHSPQLNGISQDDEVNAVFVQWLWSRNQLKWKAFGYFVDIFFLFSSLLIRFNKEKQQQKWECNKNGMHLTKKSRRRKSSKRILGKKRSKNVVVVVSILFNKRENLEKTKQKMRINAGWIAKATTTIASSKSTSTSSNAMAEYQRERRMVTAIYSMKNYLLLREHFLFAESPYSFLHTHTLVYFPIFSIQPLTLHYAISIKTHMLTIPWKEMDSSEKGELCVGFYGFRLHILFLPPHPFSFVHSPSPSLILSLSRTHFFVVQMFFLSTRLSLNVINPVARFNHNNWSINE